MYPIDKSRVYYDLNVSNINTKTGDNPVLKFSQTYGSEILKRPADYYMSIIRFSLDTSSLPILLPTIQHAQTDPKAVYYIVIGRFSYWNLCS